MISIVVAISRNGVIGKDQDLPWRLPADLRRFKAITMGKPIVMGRKTYESIGRALPGRRNIVISRNPDLKAPGCVIVASPNDALANACNADEIMIIGGAHLFEFFMPLADRVYLTEVDADVEGDVFFPGDPREGFSVIEKIHCPADDKNNYSHSFSILEKIKNN